MSEDFEGGKSVVNPIKLAGVKGEDWTDTNGIELREKGALGSPSSDLLITNQPKLERSLSKAQLRLGEDFQEPPIIKKLEWFNMYEETDYFSAMDKHVDDRTKTIGVIKSLAYTFIFLFCFLMMFIYYAVEVKEYTVTVSKPTYQQYTDLADNPAINASLYCTCSESIVQHRAFLTLQYEEKNFCRKLKTRESVNIESTNPSTTCNVSPNTICDSALPGYDDCRVDGNYCNVQDSTNCVMSYINDGYCDSVNNNEACNYDGGDCCSSTCGHTCGACSGNCYSCGYNGYYCVGIATPDKDRRKLLTPNINNDNYIDLESDQNSVSFNDYIRHLKKVNTMYTHQKKTFDDNQTTKSNTQKRSRTHDTFSTSPSSLSSHPQRKLQYYDDDIYSSYDASYDALTCSCQVSYWIGDGYCDPENNCAACNYDGGDCCPSTCNQDQDYSCGGFNYQCCDPEAADCGYQCNSNSLQCIGEGYTPDDSLYKINDPNELFCETGLQDHNLWAAYYYIEKFELVPPAIYDGLDTLCEMGSDFAETAKQEIENSFLISNVLLPRNSIESYAFALETTALKKVISSVVNSIESVQMALDLDMSVSTWGSDEAFYNMWQILADQTNQSCYENFNQKVSFNFSDYYFNSTLFYTYKSENADWAEDNEDILAFYQNVSDVNFDSYFTSTQMFCIYYLYYYGNYSNVNTVESLCMSTLDVECSYFQSVLNHPLQFFDVSISPVSPVRTVFDLFEKTGGMDDVDVVEQYEKYYSSCNPIQCQYTETRHNTAVEIAIVLLSLYGGLTLALTKFIEYTIGRYYEPTPIKPLTARYVHSPRAM